LVSSSIPLAQRRPSILSRFPYQDKRTTHDVHHLYEADDRPGGHANIASLDQEKSVFNADTCVDTSVTRSSVRIESTTIDAQNSVEVVMTQMTFSVPCHGGAFDWAIVQVTKGARVSSQSMPPNRLDCCAAGSSSQGGSFSMSQVSVQQFKLVFEIASTSSVGYSRRQAHARRRPMLCALHLGLCGRHCLCK